MSRYQLLSVFMLLILLTLVTTMVANMTRPAPPPEPAPVVTPPPPTPPVTPPGPVTPDPPVPPPAPAILVPTLERTDLDGQDLANLMKLLMWKFHFTLAEGEYTNYVWIERWTRDAQMPEVTVLSSIPGVWSEGEVVIKLPSVDHPQQYVRLGPSVTRKIDADPLDVINWRMDVLSAPSPITLDEDLHLVTFTQNRQQLATGGLKNVHQQHDRTIYLKARFTPGPFVPFELKRPMPKPPLQPEPEPSPPSE